MKRSWLGTYRNRPYEPLAAGPVGVTAPAAVCNWHVFEVRSIVHTPRPPIQAATRPVTGSYSSPGPDAAMRELQPLPTNG
jgi:hypothetical protein